MAGDPTSRELVPGEPHTPQRQAGHATNGIGSTFAGAVSGRMTMRLVRMLAAHGIDAGAVCESAKVSLDEVSNPLSRVPFDLADALLDACVEELGPDRFVVELAKIVDPETYDAAGLVLISSPTFGEGLERALAYQRLWADGERFRYERHRSGGVLRFRHPGPSRTAAAILAEVAFLETTIALRTLIGPNARPLRIDFAHANATGDADELATALGIKPSFGSGENIMVFDLATVTAPTRPPEGALAMAFELLARRALGALPTAASVSARLEALLREDIFTMTLDAAAEHLRMPPRTLQRHLQREGTSWTGLVDAARRKRVRELGLRAVPDKEIAFLVGYADPSALARARRRWKITNRANAPNAAGSARAFDTGDK